MSKLGTIINRYDAENDANFRITWDVYLLAEVLESTLEKLDEIEGRLEKIELQTADCDY